MLPCAVLHCAVHHLHCATPFCNVLCCAVPCRAVLCCAPDAVMLMLDTQCSDNNACDISVTVYSTLPSDMQDKKGGKLRRRSSKQMLLLSPDQDDMSEDGGSKSRSESMLDVARGLSASLQNIRRCAACACGSLLRVTKAYRAPKLGLQICICARVSGASRGETT